MNRLTAPILIALGLLLTGCTSGRLGAPAGEVVRYMARPPVSVVPAPATGAYALYGDPNQPPLFIFDLSAGQSVGFRKGNEGMLYGVAGEQPPFPLNGGQRYSWKRQAAAGSASAGSNNLGAPVQTVDRKAQAQIALDAAKRNYAEAQVQVDASRRRLEAAQANLSAADKARPEEAR